MYNLLPYLSTELFISIVAFFSSSSSLDTFPHFLSLLIFFYFMHIASSVSFVSFIHVNIIFHKLIIAIFIVFFFYYFCCLLLTATYFLVCLVIFNCMLLIVLEKIFYGDFLRLRIYILPFINDLYLTLLVQYCFKFIFYNFLEHFNYLQKKN